MIKSSLIKAFLVAAVALFCLTGNASAVIQEVNGMGTITSMDKSAGTINISSQYQFTISYTGSTPNEQWIPATETEVTGNAPDSKAFEIFETGDPVRYIILGGTGGDYLGIAKIDKISGDAEISAIVGDIDRMIFKPLADGFAVTAEPDPNCAECSGTTCTASSAAVTVSKDGNILSESTLLPGHFADVTDEPKTFELYIKFVKGEGLSSTCNPDAPMMMGGPQAVSTYILEVNPVAAAPVQETTAAEATPTATPQSGIAGIICLIGVLAAMAVISRK
ncbi:hypothetical protein [Methanoplanus limicola]|uniref:Uncharacterized protein n=1 Tax=Methanoplanus limicola DSM 2279 TaxID=937775 RepID=H1YXG3_9EURY|nr:hypothetical protein [Methanoplanus limicola]EHQ36900.1 hypothetical protein Metlim_2866 [Methanoplanus limicola DSM 2279]